MASRKKPAKREVPEPEPEPEPEAIPAAGWRAIVIDRIASEDYSFNALGSETGISRAAIWRYVRRRRDLRAATLEKVCAALDLVLVPREMVRDEPD
jgi:hypothetical protein